VIDAGPDFRQQMLRARITHLDAILITHEHNDHIIGLDDVRPFNFRSLKDMPVYSSKRVTKELKERFDYVFKENPYPGAPRIRLQEISKSKFFTVEEIKIQAIEVIHGKMPVLGFRIEDFTYITDAKTIAPSELEKLKGTKVLVLNALHHREHHSHLNLQQALDLVAIIQPEQAYFTHISHKMGLDKNVARLLPSNVQLAYDNLVLNLS